MPVEWSWSLAEKRVGRPVDPLAGAPQPKIGRERPMGAICAPVIPVLALASGGRGGASWLVTNWLAAVPAVRPARSEPRLRKFRLVRLALPFQV
jgi:hypothetical protein